MYESPIHITELADNIFQQISDAKEAYIMAEVKLVVDVDKDELIKALSYDRDQYYKGYADRDNEIVRCKECKHSFGYTTGHGLYGGLICETLDRDVDDEFYCSYGERREDDAEVH